jgi:hypothetical protein
VHKDQFSFEMAKKTVECPVCGISVKVENVENHLKKVHPGKKVDVEELDLPRVKRPKRIGAYPGSRAWQKWAALVVVLVVVAVVVLLMLPPGEEEEEPNYAPNFEVNDTDGQHFSLNLNIGPRPILLEFFDSNEVDSKDMASVMTNLSAQYGSQLKIVSLSWRIDLELIAFKSYYGADWTFAHASQDVIDDYGVTEYPSYFLLDTSGIIRWEFTGKMYLEDMTGFIDPWI